ncbi:MAG: carboxylating nicotinate-nucleotide diphosphorylase [Acidimicrobiales bacterium]
MTLPQRSGHAGLGATVALALAEDLGPLGDITAALLPPASAASARIVPRSDGVLAGQPAAAETFTQVDPGLSIRWLAEDGDDLVAGRPIATIDGRLASMVTAERTALNFLCHLSGIATLTRRYAHAARPARVRDTRKTTPGLRALEKAAVRAGGGVNHRGSLSDGILVKDNHLGGLAIADVVQRAHDRWPGRTVQIECDTVDQVRSAVAAGADLVLLDNMSIDEVAASVTLVDDRCRVEVSGGVTLDNVAAYAAAGADLIAIGALTHSAPALDIGLDL